MGRGRALAKCNIAVAGQYHDYPYSKVSGWIDNLGGSASTSVSTSTTHVVATEKAWKRKDRAVKEALKLIEDDEADIRIVSFDWLEDSVNNRTKKREGPYLWQKLDATVVKHDAAKAREQKAKKSKGHVGMMAEAFQDGTEKWVDPKEARQVERQIAEEQRVRATMEEEEKREKEAERKELAEDFKRKAKKAKNEIFTENHNIYADDTNFRYEVVLTKVDTRNNRNERYTLTLQIYESNSEPHTYAVNVHFAGTNQKVTNEIIVPLGSPYPPAFRAFKKAFKEKAGVEWDNRIAHAVERAKKERRDRGQATGSEYQGSGKGVPVRSQLEEEKRKKEEKDFQVLPFEYHPPRFGPRGRLPKNLQIPNELVHGKNTDIERWMMSGALLNGNESEDPIKIIGNQPEKEKSPDGQTAHFDALFNDNNGQSFGTVLDSLNDSENVLDKDLEYWIDQNLDETYPFDHHEENMALLAQGVGEDSDGRLLSINTVGEGTSEAISPFINNEIFGEQNDLSFDPIDTNMTEPPISFDLGSTIQESFQLGTQDVSDTQMAERAQGEFEDFIDHAKIAKPIDSPLADNADFGTSIFSKRKTPPPNPDSEPASPKKARYNDEEEAFALAAEESFDADEANQFVDEELAGGDGASSGALLGDSELFSPDAMVGGMDEGMEGDVVRHGRA